ncbi:MAG TPA: phosphotransferase [Flavobacteriaceae bacterium]|nr:phosphotransferase [Flavobacteriaceae bacterium]HIN98340.1 phosphotransferase [Flavobacteriaceae bacterium]
MNSKRLKCDRVMEVGSWKLEVGSWKLEAGSWELEAGWQVLARTEQSLGGL